MTSTVMNTDANSVIEQTQKWVEEGLPVDGIPFLAQISKLHWVQIETIITDLIFFSLFLVIIYYTINTYKKIQRIEKSITNLEEDHKFDRAICKEKFLGMKRV